MSNRTVLPTNLDGPWSRPGVDSHGNDFIVTTVEGKNIKTRVVRDRWIRNSKGQKLTTPKSIRRALAHHVGRYTGSMVCRVCKGTGAFLPVRFEKDPETGKQIARFDDFETECRFCVGGIPTNVCGECNEPLPGCACLRREGMLIDLEVHRARRKRKSG